MSGLTKTPLGMLEAKGTPDSDVRFTGQEVVAQPDKNINNTGIKNASYDSLTGTLTLTLVNEEVIEIDGFFTADDAGSGPEGLQGIDGTDGADGLLGKDGLQGPQGCQGPPGTPGATGPKGVQGLQGEKGNRGDEGKKGNDGDDGVIDVYIQTEDPGTVGAGALWVKP